MTELKPQGLLGGISQNQNIKSCVKRFSEEFNHTIPPVLQIVYSTSFTSHC